MSLIEDLNSQIRAANSKIEQHLEEQATAFVTTANVAITLATGLAAGIVVLARDAKAEAPTASISSLLVTAGVATIASLAVGILIYLTRARISRGAVAMWNTSKSYALRIIGDGGGDEGVTEAALALLADEMQSALRDKTAQYEESYELMVNLSAFQVSLLIVAVIAALWVALVVYL